jgi:hypothetical protein
MLLLFQQRSLADAFWSCAFSGPKGRQIQCRWREPPVCEQKESEARRADTKADVSALPGLSRGVF